MMKNIQNIEDCILELASFNSSSNAKVEDSDRGLIKSIASQNLRNIPLTDRQYDLMKTKVMKYASHFNNEFALEYHELEELVNKLRMPLRTVDREKTVRIIHDHNIWKNVKSVIQVKFPFNKKLIAAIHTLSTQNTGDYQHTNGSNLHYFRMNEKTVYEVVETLKDRNFLIDQQLLEMHEQIKQIRNQPEKYIPMIHQGTVINASESIINRINLDNVDTHDIIKLHDRKRRYGLTCFDEFDHQGLIGDIVNRSDREILIDQNKASLKEIANSVDDLDRYPMLVVLGKQNTYEQINQVFQAFGETVNPESQSVIFREEGKTEFNQFVKERTLNNWVDNNTKIVYIDEKKLPKLLMKTDWKPITALIMENQMLHRNINLYIKNMCDLIIHRQDSPFRKYSRYYL